MAYDIGRERISAERVAFVERRRKSLLREAAEESQRRLNRCLALIDKLEQERDELIAWRQTEIWAALFPHDSLASEPPYMNCIAGARLKIQSRHLPGVTNQLFAPNVFALLRDDAHHCATVATTDQAAAISGVSKAALSGEEAEWQDAKFEHDLRRRENQAAIDDHVREWGFPPNEWS